MDSSPVIDEIKGRIEKGGPMTFAEFMELALYMPGAGYYASGRPVWGREGDYITNLDVSPVFARMLAVQFHEMWLALGAPPAFDLIEAGAGRGYLSRDVMESIRGLYPDFSRAVRPALVERNPSAIDVPAGGFNIYEDIARVKSPLTGCIYSQELCDALPFHRVVEREDGLRELYVGLKHGGLTDVEGEPSTGRLGEYFKTAGVELAPGQMAEVSLQAGEWMQKAGGLIRSGFIMTVDYGHPARRLFAEGSQGTLLCHSRHTLNDDPYRDVGRQDITCHVDFTALRDAGLRAGLLPTGFTTERLFLVGLGILEELQEALGPPGDSGAALSHNQGIKDLIMPGGIGDAMKVFVQHKGVDAPALKGFSFKDMMDRL